MSAATSLMYYNDKLGKTQPRILRFFWNITAGKTISLVTGQVGSPILPTFDAYASQAVIDNFLGTTNEFLLAAFDATSMGTDAFGALINMGGQAAAVSYMSLTARTGTYGGTATSASATVGTALTASTLEAACVCGANGNIAVKAVISGLDALTSLNLELMVGWFAK